MYDSALRSSLIHRSVASAGCSLAHLYTLCELFASIKDNNPDFMNYISRENVVE